MPFLPSHTFPFAPAGHFFQLVDDPNDQLPEVRLYRERHILGIFPAPVLVVRQGLEVYGDLPMQADRVEAAARNCLRIHQRLIQQRQRHTFLRKQVLRKGATPATDQRTL